MEIQEVRKISGKRWRVTDGDTFTVLMKCRLVDYRAKELGEDGGVAAKAWLLENLPKDVQFRIVAADIYGRAVVRLYPTLDYLPEHIGGVGTRGLMEDSVFCACPRCGCQIVG